MKNLVGGKFVITINVEENGDWVPEITPVILATNGLIFCKQALLAAELLKFVQDQCVILNLDEGGKIAKLAKAMLNLDKDGNLIPEHEAPDGT